jgi:copper chaperone
MNCYFKINMNTLKFKTNIKCNNCVATVTTFLNDSEKVKEWKVDLESPDRILTITGEDITAGFVKNILLKAGYKAEEIN